jgi:hypothetical protein
MTAGLGPRAGHVVAVSCGWEALERLADRPWDLAVIGPHMADLPPVSFVAMTRTAGLGIPFVVVLRLPDRQASKTLRRMEPVAVVDDWTDGAALRAACEALLRHDAAAAPTRAQAPPGARLRALANSRRGSKAVT